MTAQTPNTPEAQASGRERSEQYLVFFAADEAFALPIHRVREIVQQGVITPVPMMPAFVRGVMNLRGHVVPVIDLAARFGQGLVRPSKRTCTMLLELEQDDRTMLMGLMVDAVDSVVELADADIEAPPTFGTGFRTDFLSGMVKRETGFTLLVNLNTVLSLGDMKRLSVAALEGARALPELAQRVNETGDTE
ncbi:chemotaxis protein CheW [Marinobacteraceae bacterium S3BR75-40.1]